MFGQGGKGRCKSRKTFRFAAFFCAPHPATPYALSVVCNSRHLAIRSFVFTTLAFKQNHSVKEEKIRHRKENSGWVWLQVFAVETVKVRTFKRVSRLQRLGVEVRRSSSEIQSGKLYNLSADFDNDVVIFAGGTEWLKNGHCRCCRSKNVRILRIYAILWSKNESSE